MTLLGQRLTCPRLFGHHDAAPVSPESGPWLLSPAQGPLFLSVGSGRVSPWCSGWYTTVIDCHDVRAQAAWWAEALGWKTIHASDDECVNIPGWVEPDTVKDIPWERIGPGMVFVPVPEDKTVKNRLHLDLAPHTSQDRDAEIARLESLGAKRADVGQPADASFTVLTDPEGNEFCVLSSRDF